MLENVLVAVGVAEGHIVKFDVALHFFPIFTLRLKHVAVNGNDFVAVRNIGTNGKQICETFDVDLRCYQVGNRVYNPANGFHHALCVRHKHRKRADFGSRDISAAPQHDRKSNRRSKVHRCREKSAQTCRMNGF